MRQKYNFAKLFAVAILAALPQIAHGGDQELRDLVYHQKAKINLGSRQVTLQAEESTFTEKHHLVMKRVRTESGAYISFMAAEAVCQAIGFEAAFSYTVSKEEVSGLFTRARLLSADGTESKETSAEVSLNIQCYTGSDIENVFDGLL